MFKVNGIELSFEEFVLLLRQVSALRGTGRRAFVKELDGDARMFGAIRAAQAETTRRLADPRYLANSVIATA